LLATADEETDEGADDEVEEGQHRPIVPGLSERESGFPTPTGRRRDRHSDQWARSPRVQPVAPVLLACLCDLRRGQGRGEPALFK